MIGRLFVVGCLVLLRWSFTVDAQVIAGQSDRTFDRARLAGMWWVGALDGKVSPSTPGVTPTFIEIEDLGIRDTESGWLAEGDFGFARRHRMKIAGSNRLSEGLTTLTVHVDVAGVDVPVQVPVANEIGITELEANYNFLFVANPGVDAGFLVGLGYFDATASATTPIGDASVQFNTPYPSLGGNMMVNPLGRFRGYVELTGFPKVTVADYSGWKLSFIVRAEMFVTQNIGAYVGYRTYEIDLEDADLQVDFNVLWKGLIVGGAVRF